MVQFGFRDEILIGGKKFLGAFLLVLRLTEQRLGPQDFGLTRLEHGLVALFGRLIEAGVDARQKLAFGDGGIEVDQQFFDRSTDDRADGDPLHRFHLPGGVDQVLEVSLLHWKKPPLGLIASFPVLEGRAISQIAAATEHRQKNNQPDPESHGRNRSRVGGWGLPANQRRSPGESSTEAA